MSFLGVRFEVGGGVTPCESCVRDILVLFTVFLRQKVTINENISFIDYASEIQLPDWSKFAIKQKMAMAS